MLDKTDSSLAQYRSEVKLSFLEEHGWRNTCPRELYSRNKTHQIREGKQRKDEGRDVFKRIRQISSCLEPRMVLGLSESQRTFLSAEAQNPAKHKEGLIVLMA